MSLRDFQKENMRILISWTTSSFHQICDFAHCKSDFSSPALAVFSICILLFGLGWQVLLWKPKRGKEKQYSFLKFILCFSCKCVILIKVKKEMPTQINQHILLICNRIMPKLNLASRPLWILQYILNTVIQKSNVLKRKKKKTRKENEKIFILWTFYKYKNFAL